MRKPTGDPGLLTRNGLAGQTTFLRPPFKLSIGLSPFSGLQFLEGIPFVYSVNLFFFINFIIEELYHVDNG